MTRAILLLGSAAIASVLATPVQVQRAQSKLQRRQIMNPIQAGDLMDDSSKYCGSFDALNPADMERAWYETQAGYYVDWFINENNGGKQFNWLRAFEKYIIDNPAHAVHDVDSKARDCGNIQSTACSPGRAGWNCQEYFEEAVAVTQELIDGNVPEYRNGAISGMRMAAGWIFPAVYQMHNKLSVIREALNEASANVSTIVDDAVAALGEKPDNGAEFLKWFGFTLDIAGQVAEMIPGGPAAAAGETLGMLSSLWGMIPEDEEAGNGELVDGLQRAFGSLRDRLGRFAELAVGSVEDENAYGELPEMAAGNKYAQTSVSKFFETGLWFADLKGIYGTGDDLVAVESIMQRPVVQLKKQLADKVMQTAGWKLYVDKSKLNPEGCGNKAGRQWIQWGEEEFCAYLARWESTHGTLEPEEEFYNVHMHNYGLGDRDTYYRHLLDCSWNGGGEQDDMNNIHWDGEVPRCYFNLPVMRCEAISRDQWALCSS